MSEGLYVVEFGDVGTAATRNGGVAVLETNRIFGGDSGYYYLGKFSISAQKITATATIVKHNPALPNVFGDAATTFDITIIGDISGGVISGYMERTDMPGLKLPIRLTKKADLP